MQAKWIVRVAVFVAVAPLTGAWCIVVLRWLKYMSGSAPSGAVLFTSALVTLACVIGGASWMIRGPWWFRLPTTVVATLGGLWMAFRGALCAVTLLGG